MPMPEPTPTESESEFISRCMGDDTMVEDFEDNGQRYAICLRQYDAAQKQEDMPENEDDGMEQDDMVMIPMEMLVELLMNQKPKE